MTIAAQITSRRVNAQPPWCKASQTVKAILDRSSMNQELAEDCYCLDSLATVQLLRLVMVDDNGNGQMVGYA